LQINANDGNYCPSLVDVFVGDVPTDLKKLRTVPLTPTGTPRKGRLAPRADLYTL